MKFVLTNDDGIAADGLQALFHAAEGLGERIVIAPSGPQSGISHAVTTDKPMQWHSVETGRWAVDGTPADCTRAALHAIARDTDWLLSGINHGGNLGADFYYSGTVAAVREGVLHGWPGIALSQYRKRNQEWDWPRATRWATRAIQHILQYGPEVGVLWNVNFPHLRPDEPEPQLIECPLDPNPLPLDFRHDPESGYIYSGNYHNRRRVPGSDVDVCFCGNIAITCVKLF